MKKNKLKPVSKKAKMKMLYGEGGSILNQIGEGIQMAAPLLGMIPGVGMAAAPIAGLLGGAMEQMGEGGKIKPYVTNDPNDPRIQSYKDSSDKFTNSYNELQQVKKQTKQEINAFNYRADKYLSESEKLAITGLQATNQRYGYKPQYEEKYYDNSELDKDIGNLSSRNKAKILGKSYLRDKSYTEAIGERVSDKSHFNSGRETNSPIGYYAVGDYRYDNTRKIVKDEYDKYLKGKVSKDVDAYYTESRKTPTNDSEYEPYIRNRNTININNILKRRDGFPKNYRDKYVEPFDNPLIPRYAAPKQQVIYNGPKPQIKETITAKTVNKVKPVSRTKTKPISKPVEPYYTDNPNDPRIKQYNDSLNNNKWSNKELKKMVGDSPMAVDLKKLPKEYVSNLNAVNNNQKPSKVFETATEGVPYYDAPRQKVILNKQQVTPESQTQISTGKEEVTKLAYRTDSSGKKHYKVNDKAVPDSVFNSYKQLKHKIVEYGQGGSIGGVQINAEQNELIVDPKNNKVKMDLRNLPPHPKDPNMMNPNGTLNLPEDFKGDIVIPKSGPDGRDAFLKAKKMNDKPALNRIKRNLTNKQAIKDAAEAADATEMYKEGGKIYLKQPNKKMGDGGGIKTDYFDRELPYRPELNPAMDMGNYQIGHGLNYGGMGDVFNTSKSNVANSDPANIPYRRTSGPTPPPTTKSGGPFIGPPPMEPLDPNGLGSGTGSPFNLGTSLLNNAGNLYQLGNAIFNQDDTSVVNNKLQNKAMGLMEGRRYNAKPELDANKSSVAGANYALKNSGTQNGSEVRSRLTDVLRSKFTADSRVLANKQNMDNGYMGEEAQMKNQMGEYNRNEDIRVNTANEQNRANRQDMIGSSLSSMGRNTQMQMNDQTRIDLLPSLFPGMGTDGNEILKQLLGRK